MASPETFSIFISSFLCFIFTIRYAEIVNYYMEHNDYEQIIKTCKKFG